MTKQSNKNKFLATAVTATMVATAFAPVASVAAAETTFPDVDPNVVGQSSADAVAALAEAGIIKGIDGQFKPGASISRAEASQMVAKLFDLKTGEVKNETTFEDVKDNAWYTGAINSLVEKDILKGKSATSFEPGSDIKRSELALVLVKAYGLQDVNVDDVELPYTDVKAGSWYEKSVKILYKEGLLKGTTATTFSPDSPMKRVDFARLAVETDYAHGTKLPKPTEAVAVESVKAINAKTIEVTFNQEVDRTKAEVELLRGSFKQNVTLTWADDNKSVQLAGANNFQPAEYTVTIKGLTEEALTETVKVEAQKVDSIEILDDVAVIQSGEAISGVYDDKAKATVSYIVKDQYGTDVTKNANFAVDTNGNGVTADKGTVTITGAAINGKKIGDLIPVVLIDTKTGTSTTKTLKLSAESTVSSIDVAGIYNAKGEVVALNDLSKPTDGFIVLNLKDQYGKEITAKDKAEGLHVTNTNKTNLEVESAVSEQKIGEDTKLVVKISKINKAGNTDIILISTTNGQSATYTVEVAETTTTDAITVSQPEIAVVDEETEIPVTVSDKEGNVITDTKLLADKDKGIKVSGQETVKPSDFVVKDGQVFFKKTFKEKGTQALVFQSSTYKVATITVDVKAAEEATAIRGLKNPLVVKKGEDNAVTITAKEHLIIEDQYGRVMKNDASNIKVELVGESDVVSVDKESNKVTGLKNGTATLKIQLEGDTKGDSAIEVKVQVTDGKEYKSYEVKDLGLLDVKEGNKLVVSGVLENGGKVELKGTDYVATTNVTGVVVENGELKVQNDNLDNVFKVDDKDVTERDVKVTFTINNDGTKVEHTYKISKEASKVQDFFFTSSDAVKDAVVITEINKTGTFTIADTKVVTTDQYGKKEIVTMNKENDALTSVTIKPADASKVTITGNGTKGATVTASADTTVTATVKIGDATIDLKVNLKASK